MQLSKVLIYAIAAVGVMAQGLRRLLRRLLQRARVKAQTSPLKKGLKNANSDMCNGFCTKTADCDPTFGCRCNLAELECVD
ncbi:hypothetical protein V2G26_004754 [Clonostachys chloroleuca]